tara:strand:- start:9399 stop:10430 length:1032 start_codon:yes stop_codon:yes gene_type:complete
MKNNKFHKPVGPFSLFILAELVGAKIFNYKKSDEEKLVYDAADIDNAQEGFITFVNVDSTLHKIKSSRASVCLVKKYNVKHFHSDLICLEVDDPHSAFGLISQKFYPDILVEPLISKNCEISDKSKCSKLIRVDSYSVIEEGVKIGDNVWIGSGCYIGKGVEIGENTRIMSNSSIECAIIGKNVLIYHGVKIGQRGFGFAPTKSGHVKIAQVGRVVVQDNVEIGANTCVDRGSYGDTIIGMGTYIDNLVHIAHNVKIGKHCAIAGQVGIAGSSVIDDFCMFGGQVGIGGHINIGKGVQAGGQAGITKSLLSGSKVSGTPAIPLNDYHRQSILLKRLIKNKGKN